MEIGTLGGVNAYAQTKSEISSGNTTGKFSLLFASLTASGAGNAEKADSSLSSESEKVDLPGLIDYLNNPDLLEMEDGFKLADIALSGSGKNLLETALAMMNLTPASIEGLKETNEAGEPGVKKELTDEEIEAALAAFLSTLIRMDDKQFQVALDKTGVAAVKAIKLFDLLSGYKDCYAKDGKKLDETLEQLTEKLTGLLENRGSSRMDMLQQKFSQAAFSINQAAQKNSISQEHASGLNKSDGISGEENKIISPMTFISRPEQLTLLQNGSGKPVTADQLIRQFESILSRSKFSNINGVQKLALKLFPEHLGSIRIEIIQKEHGLIARIFTTTQTAKESLDANLNGLRSAFSSQNLQIDKLEITNPETQQERSFSRDSRQEREDREQDGAKKDEADKEPARTFENVLVNTEV
ncbi:flagellar hook-length control protein FliK [Mesobacillus zeae]|uniref:Flagellar hook-length control protein FliK n=1 Tax=Mesobacillus zeae TaxID=1917180 RepID=A0A398BDW4_9BACI|nr:flagellar hook-length control protein FliK [Mesobacillus zeae]RID87997.1 flagellar hook-length control protein FliK [Mesobacillus zeae]